MKDPLSHALRNLPRHHAGEGFTDSLNARLETGPPRSHRTRRAASWALAVVLAAAAGAALLLVPQEKPTPRTATATEPQLEDIRLQYERLSHDLAQLKSFVEEAEPVIYLGGEENLGILLPRQAPAGDHFGERPYTSGLPQPVRVLAAARDRL